MVLVDLEKVYATVPRPKLWEALQSLNINDHLLRSEKLNKRKKNNSRQNRDTKSEVVWTTFKNATRAMAKKVIPVETS